MDRLPGHRKVALLQAGLALVGRWVDLLQDRELYFGRVYRVLFLFVTDS